MMKQKTYRNFCSEDSEFVKSMFIKLILNIFYPEVEYFNKKLKI